MRICSSVELTLELQWRCRGEGPIEDPVPVGIGPYRIFTFNFRQILTKRFASCHFSARNFDLNKVRACPAGVAGSVLTQDSSALILQSAITKKIGRCVRLSNYFFNLQVR